MKGTQINFRSKRDIKSLKGLYWTPLSYSLEVRKGSILKEGISYLKIRMFLAQLSYKKINGLSSMEREMKVLYEYFLLF